MQFVIIVKGWKDFYLSVSTPSFLQSDKEGFEREFLFLTKFLKIRFPWDRVVSPLLAGPVPCHFTLFISHTSVRRINLGRSSGTLLKRLIIFIFSSLPCLWCNKSVFPDRIESKLSFEYAEVNNIKLDHIFT